MLYEQNILGQPPYSGPASVESCVNLACDDGQIPGVVMVASGPDNFSYCAAVGPRSSKEGKSKEQLSADSTFWMASCTKLVTAVAALQCVERKLLTLDEDITDILSEFRNMEVLTAFRPDGLFEYRPNPNAMTLRHLLTHTSGISYDSFSPLLRQFRHYHKSQVSSSSNAGKVSDSLLYPLVFASGTSWEYGAGLDWVGQAIERVTGMSLEKFFGDQIFKPLGMYSSTFRLHARLDVKQCLMDMSNRDGLIHPMFGTSMSPDGAIIPASDDEPLSHVFPAGIQEGDDYGGSGLYGSAGDFAKILHSLCSNDGLLLSPAMVHELFRPQLNDAARNRLAQIRREFPPVNASFGGANVDALCDWSLGGMLMMGAVQDVGELRHLPQGTLFWGGLPNVYWFMDRVAGISGVFATQLLPQGDLKCLELVGRFEREIRERVREALKGEESERRKAARLSERERL